MTPRKKEHVEVESVGQVKTDARYRLSLRNTIAVERLASALGISGLSVIEQLVGMSLDQHGKIVIANYDLGLKVRLSTSILELNDHDLEVIETQKKKLINSLPAEKPKKKNQAGKTDDTEKDSKTPSEPAVGAGKDKDKDASSDAAVGAVSDDEYDDEGEISLG